MKKSLNRPSRKGLNVGVKDTILVSLDCFRCKRSGRTVVMYKDQEKTFCTPTSHRFPGRIVSIDVSDRKKVGLSSTKSVITAKYGIEHDFESFVDKKYPHREIKPEPTWSRVTFLLMCRCGKQTEAETQNNIGRPWKAVCKCGKDLYYEENQIPLFQNTTRV